MSAGGPLSFVGAAKAGSHGIFSLGLVIDEKDASILEVRWGSPAFKAKLTESTQLLAINGIPYSADVLKAAIQSAKSSNSPIELIVKTQDRYRVVNLDYHEGLRFPHLERDPSVRGWLDELLSPK
jgi:predicted metalloprotease with PDZ domain